MASPTVWYEKHEAKCIKEMAIQFYPCLQSIRTGRRKYRGYRRERESRLLTGAMYNFPHFR